MTFAPGCKGRDGTFPKVDHLLVHLQVLFLVMKQMFLQIWRLGHLEHQHTCFKLLFLYMRTQQTCLV